MYYIMSILCKWSNIHPYFSKTPPQFAKCTDISVNQSFFPWGFNSHYLWIFHEALLSSVWVANSYDTFVWITSSSWQSSWYGYRGGRSSHDGCSLGDLHHLWTRPDFNRTFNRVSREHSSAHARLYLSSIRILWIFLR